MPHTPPWLDPDVAARPTMPWALSCIPHTPPPWLVGVQAVADHELHEAREEARPLVEPLDKARGYGA